jgi:uncharacterized membrane protein
LNQLLTSNGLQEERHDKFSITGHRDACGQRRKKYATIVYALYGADFLIGITALAGLILAYMIRQPAAVPG